MRSAHFVRQRGLVAETIVQSGAQEIGGVSEIFRENHSGNAVIEYGAVAEIDVEIFHLERPYLIEHCLYAETGSPSDDRLRARPERAVSGNIADLAVQ